MSGHEDLVVWQKSYALALQVYRETRDFPKSETFGLTSQLRRAAVSIPANIAEGHGRASRADYLRFLAIARGSKGELETLLSFARDLTYLKDRTAQQLLGSAAEVGRMLTSLVQTLRAPQPGPRRPAP